MLKPNKVDWGVMPQSDLLAYTNQNLKYNTNYSCLIILPILNRLLLVQAYSYSLSYN